MIRIKFTLKLRKTRQSIRADNSKVILEGNLIMMVVVVQSLKDTEMSIFALYNFIINNHPPEWTSLQWRSSFGPSIELYMLLNEC